MELVDVLKAGEPAHGWFTDRPNSEPPAYLEEVLERLPAKLPRLAPDIGYIGVELPAIEALPSTEEILKGHATEKAHAEREVPDYSNVPVMARDSAETEDSARAVLARIEALKADLDAASEAQGTAVRHVATAAGAPTREDLRQLAEILEMYREAEAAAQVRFTLGACALEDFAAAAERACAGQKPAGIFSSRKLKDAVASVRVGNSAPAGPSEWRAVHAACRIAKDRDAIAGAAKLARDTSIVGSLGQEPWDVARYAVEEARSLRTAVALAEEMEAVCEEL